MKETLRHTEAFEYYYSLGKDRNFASVARQFGVSERNVARWSKAFDWQARLEQRDAKNGARLQEKTDEGIVATKARYRKIIRAHIAAHVKELNAGNIKADSIPDLLNLMKMDLLLMGEATEKTDHRHSIEEVLGISNLNDDEFQQRLAEAANHLAAGSVSQKS